MGGETDILKKSKKRWKTAAKKDLLNASESPWVCVFVLLVCAKRSQDDCSSISTKSAFEQLIYTVQQLTSKLQLLQKTIRPMAFKMTVQALKSAHAKHLNPVPFRPIRLSNPKLVHSIMPLSFSPSFSFWFIFDWFLTFFTVSFPASFIQYSVSGLGISFFLTCRYCFRSLVPLFSLVWVGWEPEEVFEMHATGMCHSCIVSACEYTHIIDDIQLMAFWYVTVMFSQDKKRGEVSDRRELPMFH